MSKKTFTGGCLCGGVRYRASGEVLRFYHCHCGRCRKTNGTGHASNIMLKGDALEWLQGEALLGHYKVPEAERFYNRFCKQCGSPLPRDVPNHGLLIIPAGTLDSDPGIRPEARIFWDSRAEWSCEAGELPTYSEYPE